MNKNSKKQNKNWLIFLYFVQNNYEECLKVIQEVLQDTNMRSEFANYIKGIILRSQGKINDSLQMFKWTQRLNPFSLENIKQVGRCLYLLGRAKPCIDLYEQALRMHRDDWETWHCKGMCHMNLNQLSEALECFRTANLIQKHDVTFMQLGEVYMRSEDHRSAIDNYLEALEFSPENSELLTTLGLLYLRLGNNFKAFQYLGNALTLDNTNSKALLATGSIIQDRSDHDAALLKYRIIAANNPNSAQLWNNIGMCFFGKAKYVAAISCLKKAQYLDPFEWIVPYNLGIAHLNTKQYASSFHYFNAAISLNPNYFGCYMYLGLALSNLGDFENACNSYEKALILEEDFMVFLNYAVSLFNYGKKEKAKEMYTKFKKAFDELDPSTRDLDMEVQETSRNLASSLEMPL